MASSAPDDASKDIGIKYPCIFALAIDNPELVVSQERTAAWMASVGGIQKTKSIIPGIYKNTMINTRHLANPDFSLPFDPQHFSFFPQNDQLLPAPSIEYRLEKFREYAWPVVDRVVTKLFKDCPDMVPSDIGKIVFVSNTGFLAPGLDCSIIKKYKLPNTTERLNLSFMGCAAGINGLHACMDYVQSHPNKKVLLVCIEISSIHSAFGDNINDVIIHALFADGCAGAIIGMSTAAEASGKILVVEKMSMLVPESEDGIVLDIRNSGITCTLAKVLSTYLEASVGSYTKEILEKVGLQQKDVDFWGVHPGGTRILQAVQNSLGLTEKDLSESWEVLAKYGNMLSPSIFFVLQKHLQKYKDVKQEDQVERKPYEIGLTFSFSPGIGIEGSVLRYVY